MGRERTLLARISAGMGKTTRALQPTTTEDVEALAESVRINLGRVLNSRHGMSECTPDYGLPAINDLTTGHGEYIQTVERAIQTAIEKYEPRLQRTRVTRIVDEDHGRTLSFRVEGTLVGRSGQHRVWYETSLRGNQFDVEG